MSTTPHYDAIVIGAGIAGMYQLYRLRELGMNVRVFEDGSDVGGTWYWNRYPGARFDSESYTYCYSWDKELLQEWNWKEHFSAQPENMAYYDHVATKFDLRKDITFNARVSKATYDEAANEWEIETEKGERARARFLITAVGVLSATQMPRIPGVDKFKGISFHTSRWPKAETGFGGKDIGMKGKRVGVIGTGATGVQLIQEVAKVAGHLTVFQLAPEFCAPLRNALITDEEQANIKATYPEIFKRCNQNSAGFMHEFVMKSALDVSEKERNEFFEYLYARPGFEKWLGNYYDIMSNRKANDLITEFMSNKIRSRVKDPVLAEKLVPKNHGFGMRRVPMDTNYYEVYNQDNVTLVDLRETPITTITEKGVQTSDKEHELDILIYATGFDAVTGSFTRIDITGVGGKKLKDKWADGPVTYLGMGGHDFPNFLTLVGPHNGATFCNIPRCIEQNVEWVSDMMKYMRDKKLTRLEPTTDAEKEWTAHVAETSEVSLFTKTDSWFMGVNINMPEKKRGFLLYAGGSQAYKAKCEEVAAKGYEGFALK
jgi:cation diffusion facilitator CzcD-associated flavoprotein CzcO